MSKQHICASDICPNKQYHSRYWSDCDQTFWTQFFGVIIFVNPNALGFFFTAKIFSDPIFFRIQTFSDLKFCQPKTFFAPQTFFNFFFQAQNLFSVEILFKPNIFLHPKCFSNFFFRPKLLKKLTKNIISPQNFLEPQFLWTKKF